MCLAADVPLVESGTQGYLGQAYVIKKVCRIYLRICMNYITELFLDSLRRNVLIVNPSLHLQHILFVLLEVHLVLLFIALFGQRAFYSGKDAAKKK